MVCTIVYLKKAIKCSLKTEYGLKSKIRNFQRGKEEICYGV